MSISRYALDYTALEAGWATQGAADYCQANGHARYTRDGVDQGYCPRCLDTTAPVSEFTDADLISPEAFEPAPVFAPVAPALTPGAVFSTPFESGCVVVTAPDAFGSFDALDSDGVLCSFGVSMVISINR